VTATQQAKIEAILNIDLFPFVTLICGALPFAWGSKADMTAPSQAAGKVVLAHRYNPSPLRDHAALEHLVQDGRGACN
jgi:hypothetical protein